MKNNAFAVIGTSVLVLLAACGEKQSERQTVFRPPVVSLGEFDSGPDMDFSLLLINEDVRPSNLVSLTTTCGCTTVDIEGGVTTLIAGDIRKLKGRVKGNRAAGPFSVRVILEYQQVGDDTIRQCIAEIKGTVRVPATIAPERLRLSEFSATDHPKQETFKIERGGANLKWDSVQVDAGPMFVSNVLKENEDIYHVEVTFNPSKVVTDGKFREYINIRLMSGEKAVYSFKIPALGRLSGGTKSIPGTVYLGNLKRSESKEGIVTLVGDFETIQTIEVHPSSSGIKLWVENSSASHAVIRYNLENRDQPAGVFEARFKIRFSNQKELVVPVIGFLQK